MVYLKIFELLTHRDTLCHDLGQKMSYFITAHKNYKKSIRQSIHGEPISCVSIHDKDSSMQAWVDLAAATRHSLKYTIIRH
jgi:hypothetical protein